MNQTILAVLLLPLSILTYGQITTTKITTKKERAVPSYDSTKNYVGTDVELYTGQELYLNGKAESLREYGYSGFVWDYTRDVYKLSNTYKPLMPEERYSKYDLGGGKSHYDSITGHYFKVLEVKHIPEKSWKGNFLKLLDKQSGDTIYFEYDEQFEHAFPFIVVGFFEKQKKSFVGKEFVIADHLLENLTDIQTGNPITNKTGQRWKCTDLTIEDIRYSLCLLIENALGERTNIQLESIQGENAHGNIYEVNKAEQYKKKFGQDQFNRILQGKVKIGMTKEMCKLSWGEPTEINETIMAGRKTEQWIYSENYLYFENGILTTIQ